MATSLRARSLVRLFMLLAGVAAFTMVWAGSAMATTSLTLDPGLDDAVRWELDKWDGPITDDDMRSLQYLDASYEDISSLNGIEYATNLSVLYINDNAITDISRLAGLAKLVELDIAHNKISNIDAISGMTSLQKLWAAGNTISNIGPVSALTSLTYISFYQNQVSDVRPLKDLTNLKSLYLPVNQISDVTPLAGLTQLTSLGLGYNPITDITPLKSLMALTYLELQYDELLEIGTVNSLPNLTSLYVKGNYLDLTAGSPTMSTISGMTARGATVGYTPQRGVFIVQASAGSHGKVAPVGSVRVIPGRSCAVTFTPDTCYHVSSVLVDGASAGAVKTYTFTNVVANHTIAGTFALDTFTTKLSASAPTSVYVNHTYRVTGSVACTPTPRAPASGKVKLVFKRYYSGAWRQVGTSKYATLSSGKFAYSAKPATKGSWRVYISYAGATTATGKYKAATTIYRSFKVK